jgi:hypothetical protein
MDVNSQYDVFSGYASRQVSAGAEPRPLFDRDSISAQRIIDDMMSRRYKIYKDVDDVPPGITVRRYIAQRVRDNLQAHNGHDYETCSDAETLGSTLYSLLPNFLV